MALMLIGNKTDLAKMREVKTEDAATYAEKEQMAILETSALDSTNVNFAFECIINGKQPNPAHSALCRNLQTEPSVISAIAESSISWGKISRAASCAVAPKDRNETFSEPSRGKCQIRQGWEEKVLLMKLIKFSCWNYF